MVYVKKFRLINLSCMLLEKPKKSTSKIGYCSQIVTKYDCLKYWRNHTKHQRINQSYIVECVKGFYGKNCEEICSTNCNSKSCDPITGQCVGGCQEGWIGSECDTSKELFKEIEIKVSRIKLKAQHKCLYDTLLLLINCISLYCLHLVIVLIGFS